MIQVNLL